VAAASGRGGRAAIEARLQRPRLAAAAARGVPGARAVVSGDDARAREADCGEEESEREEEWQEQQDDRRGEEQRGRADEAEQPGGRDAHRWLHKRVERLLRNRLELLHPTARAVQCHRPREGGGAAEGLWRGCVAGIPRRARRVPAADGWKRY